MKNKITVIVPATSANCGPGYDSLGLACNLYNDFTFEILDTPGFALEVIGEGEDRLRAGGRNLAFLSFLKVWNEVRGTRIGLKVTMQNRIPLSRGLGSSSTAIVAGLVAANLLTGSTLPKERLLNYATEIEGHPDNVAPALLGGITISYMDRSGAHSLRFLPQKELRFIAVVPDHEDGVRVGGNQILGADVAVVTMLAHGQLSAAGGGHVSAQRQLSIS